MQILVNTNQSIDNDARLTEHVEEVVEKRLAHYASHITRVEVHLSDANADKSGDDDTRCMVEVRPTGRKPIAVTHFAGNVADAVRGASDKMQRALEKELAKTGRR
ncbi:MAG: HPF/RaiA family ribosome-associated protein [Myxococcota bacterium]